MYLFFFNDTATTEIYTLSLHDALPIFKDQVAQQAQAQGQDVDRDAAFEAALQQAGLTEEQLRQQIREQLPVQEVQQRVARSEEHTSELQSRQYLVCRLLLEKKKK